MEKRKKERIRVKNNFFMHVVYCINNEFSSASLLDLWNNFSFFLRTEEEEKLERKCCYESYRTLVQIDATGGIYNFRL